MNKALIYGGILVAIVIALVSFTKTPDTIVGAVGPQGKQGIQGPQGPAGKDGRDGRDGKNATSEQSFGSVVGPDNYLEYVGNNDLRTFSRTKALLTSTTTVCAIKSPSATSTLTFAGVSFTRSSTTASVVTLAKAATAFATTTALNTLTLAANAQGAQIATSSTSAVGVAGNNIFAPNQYFVVGMQGGAGTFSPVGTCSAEFKRI